MRVLADHLHLLPTFVRAAELKNFSAVARELRVTPVAVSKNIATLENTLSVRLFHRSTRAISLTEEGSALYASCAGPIQALLAAARPNPARTDIGTVRITSIAPFAKHILIPILAKFAQVHANIRVELVFETRVANMVEEDIDLGIRAGAPPQGDLLTRVLCELPFVICGAPEYFRRWGVPTIRADLSAHRCLQLGGLDRRHDFEWTLPGATSVRQRVRGTFATSDVSGIEQAALHGMGLWLAPLPAIVQHLRAERLKLVLPDLMRRGASLHLHYRNRRNLPQRTRTTRDFIVDQVRAHPDLHVDPLDLCRPFWL
jgi:DNA-binding transcriptional LysR family regulator